MTPTSSSSVCVPYEGSGSPEPASNHFEKVFVVPQVWYEKYSGFPGK